MEPRCCHSPLCAGASPLPNACMCSKAPVTCAREAWRPFPRMASFGLAEAAEAIRQRVGHGARYSSFTPPGVVRDEPPSSPWRRWEHLLWRASLVLLGVVLVLAILVAFGL